MSSSYFCRMGNKKYLLKKMLPLFPTDYDTFVDCFVGSGVVFLNLPDLKNKKVVINDLDKSLIEGHRLLKKHTPTDKFEKIVERMYKNGWNDRNKKLNAVIPHYNQIYEEFKKGNTLEDKLMVQMIKHCGGFSGRVVTNRVYQIHTTKLMKSTLEKYKEKMKSVKSITSIDYKRVVNKYKNDPNAFIYLDPPYEKSKGLYDQYTIDFPKMADLLRGAKCRWFISINDSPYIRECFKDFNIKETSVISYSGKTATGDKNKIRKELFITNYSLTGKGVFDKEEEDSDAESCGCGCSGEGKSDEEGISVKLYESPIKSKKYRAIWFDKDGEEIRHTDFGAKRYEDYTIHNDRVRKNRYIRRHKKNEDWEDPYTAGALSRWVLWEKPDLKDSWNFYKDKFGFK